MSGRSIALSFPGRDIKVAARVERPVTCDAGGPPG